MADAVSPVLRFYYILSTCKTNLEVLIQISSVKSLYLFGFENNMFITHYRHGNVSSCIPI